MKKQIFCFGLTKIGEKGQLVIPIEARKKWNFKPGDKFLVLGTPKKSLILIKADEIEKFIRNFKKEIQEIEKKLKTKK